MITYELAAHLPQFVIPPPEEDVYRGSFVPNVDALALNSIYVALQNYSPYRFGMRVLPGVFEDPNGRGYSDATTGRPGATSVLEDAIIMIPHTYVSRSHTEVEVPVPGMADAGPDEFEEEMKKWLEPALNSLWTEDGYPVPVAQGEHVPPEVKRLTIPERTDIKTGIIDCGQRKSASPFALQVRYAEVLEATVYRPQDDSLEISDAGKHFKDFTVLMGNSVELNIFPVGETGTENALLDEQLTSQ